MAPRFRTIHLLPLAVQRHGAVVTAGGMGLRLHANLTTSKGLWLKGAY
jgi:hypothetical protein